MRQPLVPTDRSASRSVLGAVAGVLLAAAALAGCASTPESGGQPVDGVTFVVVRHAEKADDGTRDPALSNAGAAHAQALALRLRDAPVRAAYATAYHRTQQTALPTAQAHGLEVITYDANQSATEFAGALRQRHQAGQVLVVGHSNTAAQIAAALCGCEVPAIADHEFDRLITVRIDAGGRAALAQERY